MSWCKKKNSTKSKETILEIIKIFSVEPNLIRIITAIKAFEMSILRGLPSKSTRIHYTKKLSKNLLTTNSRGSVKSKNAKNISGREWENNFGAKSLEGEELRLRADRRI